MVLDPNPPDTSEDLSQNRTNLVSVPQAVPLVNVTGNIPHLLRHYMCFTPDARGTEFSNSVPAGIEFQNDHECEARGMHFSLGPSA